MLSVNSKSRRANKLYNVDDEWALTLLNLRLKVKGSWFNGLDRNEKKKWFGGMITGFNSEEGMWKIRMDCERAIVYQMRYDTVLKYVDEHAANFESFQLPADPIPPPNQHETVGTTKYLMTKSIEWTQVFEDTENPPAPIEPLPYEGDQEEFDVNITDAELEQLKDSNGVLRFEKVVEWCLPQFDNGEGAEKIGLFEW